MSMQFNSMKIDDSSIDIHVDSGITNEYIQKVVDEFGDDYSMRVELDLDSLGQEPSWRIRLEKYND